MSKNADETSRAGACKLDGGRCHQLESCLRSTGRSHVQLPQDLADGRTSGWKFCVGRAKGEASMSGGSLK